MGEDLHIFVVAYDQPYATSYTVGGFASPGIITGGEGIPQLTASGFSSHLFVRMDRFPVRDAFDTPSNHSVTGVTAHEYGHVLDMWHPPYSGNYTYARYSYQIARSGPCAPAGDPPRYHITGCPPNPSCCRCGHAGEPACADPMYINVGRYDVMRGIVGPDPPERVNPYHPLQLVYSPKWIMADTIRADVRDFHIPQLRNPDPSKRKVYIVKPELSPEYFGQYFLLSNHQGDPASPTLQFDANYQGRGLLVWHILGDRVWDLESAAGEVPDIRLGQPFDPLLPISPPHRGDGLARSWTFLGGAGDFYSDFYGVTDFSATTSPNSNFYAEDFGFFSPQSIVSHIGVENIRQDPSGDMIVDIYVDPTQYVTYPNGGEFIAKGQSFTMTWQERPWAGISHVHVMVSGDGGQSWSAIAPGYANTGEFVVGGGITQVGTQFRMGVQSFDQTADALDGSDANFTVWGIDEATIQEMVTQDCNGAITFDISWSTSVATDGWDSLLVYTPGSCGVWPPQVARAASQGTTHRVAWQGTCQSGYWCYKLKSAKGTGVTASSSRYVNVAECWTETTQVPSVVDASMAAWADVNPDPEFMTLHFSFGTTQCATEFEVQYRVYGTSTWSTLTCTAPGATCIFNANKTYERTQGYSPCEATRFQWRAKAKNWNGWQPTYSATKSFWAYCLQEP